MPRSDAYTALAEQLTPEQKRLLLEVDAERNASWVDEQQAVVDELKRHMPLLSAMIQLTYEHAVDQRVALRGVCCSGTPVEGERRYV
jgi:hypothetical protein